MVTKAETQSIRGVAEGIIQPIDSSVRPSTSVYLACNLVFHDKLGRMVVRNGSTQLGSQITDGMSCLGLYTHVTTGGTKVPLAVFNATGDATSVVSKYTSSTWSNAKTGLTASAKMRFATFLDTTVGVNGTDVISSTDGASWVTTGGNLDIGNMPVGKYVIEFQDRIYTAGVSSNPDRLYFSAVPVGGTISWTSGNGYIDIEPEEGAGSITGLAKVPDYVLIFKERSVKRWDYSSTFPESLVDIGCPSQEGIVMTKQSVFYFNRRGIYETTGGYPRKVSSRIQDIIDAIPSTYYASVSGWGDGESVFFSIGDITLEGQTYSNVVVEYRIDTQVWTMHTYPTEIKVWSCMIDSYGDYIVIAGDDDGNVWQMFTGLTDGSTSIPWEVIWKEIEFGSRGKEKTISRTIIYSENVPNGVLSVKRDGDDTFRIINNFVSRVSEIKDAYSGNYFDIKLQGVGAAAEIIGIDFEDIIIGTTYGNQFTRTKY